MKRIKLIRHALLIKLFFLFIISFQNCGAPSVSPFKTKNQSLSIEVFNSDLNSSSGQSGLLTEESGESHGFEESSGGGEGEGSDIGSGAGSGGSVGSGSSGQSGGSSGSGGGLVVSDGHPFSSCGTLAYHDKNAKPASPVTLHEKGVATTWTWQLSGSVNTSYDVDVYDIDLFDSSESLIQSLKQNGKKVVCYFSGGSSENWRSDFNDFCPQDLGQSLDGWAGEGWLDIRSKRVFDIMKRRMDLAKQKGCDGVEPDNMDAYLNKNGKGLKADDQLAYNKAIARYARSIGLSVALKNDTDQVVDLEPHFDFAVTEQCAQYSECEAYLPFINQGKAVFNAEYDQKYKSSGGQTALCAESKRIKIQTLVLDLDLNDSYRYACFE